MPYMHFRPCALCVAHRKRMKFILPPCVLRSKCQCTVLFCLRTHNWLVQYSETKLCQPQHTLTHSDTDSIALAYSPEWDQETRCCVIDRLNHKVFSCQYTSVKLLSICQMHQYTVWQETWYRFSGYWLKNSFAGKVHYLLVLLTKYWCFECTSPEGIWRTKWRLILFWVAIPESNLTFTYK